MSAKHKPIKIIVRPDAGAEHGYSFEMQDNKVPKERLTFDKKADDMSRQDHHRIEFELKNQGGADLKFSNDLTKVFWVKEIKNDDDPCPKSPAYMPEEIWAAEVDDDELEVVNMNLQKKKFAFTINFLHRNEQDSPTANYIPFDPIGENRNGGSIKLTTAVVISGVALVAGLAGATAGYAACAQKSKGR